MHNTHSSSGFEAFFILALTTDKKIAKAKTSFLKFSNNC